MNPSGSYSGEIANDIRSGGKTTAAFGAINFGANSTLGGATTSASDSSGSNTLLYIIAAIVGIYFLMKR